MFNKSKRYSVEFSPSLLSPSSTNCGADSTFSSAVDVEARSAAAALAASSPPESVDSELTVEVSVKAVTAAKSPPSPIGASDEVTTAAVSCYGITIDLCIFPI